jgi:hypothetical protein
VRAAAVAGLWGLAAAIVTLRLAAGATTTDPRALAVAAFVLVAGIGWFMAGDGVPTLAGLARAADERFGLGERLSTLVGLDPAPGGWRAPIEAGLRRDVAARASAIRPSQMAPVADWSLGLAIVVLAASIAVFQLVPATAPVAVAVPPVAASAVTVNPATRTQNLKTIADALGADAKARQNDYLQAVSDAVDKLSQTPGLTDQQYNTELTGLLAHASLAYGKALPAWLLGDAAAPGDPFHLSADSNYTGLANGASGQADDGKAGGGEEMVPELLSEQGLQTNVAPPPPAAGKIKLAPNKGDLAIDNSDVGTNTNTSTAKSMNGKSSPAGAGGAPPSLGQTKPKSLGDVTGASGIPLGAATQSGDGASRIAGQGTQALEDGARQAAAQIPLADQVMLPPSQYQQGKRLRIEVLPKDETGKWAIESGLVGPLSSDGRQTPVTRGVPSVRDQATFARYFTHGEAS